VSKTQRRLIVPAVVGVSAAALAQFVPGVAVAAAHQASHTAPKADSAGIPSTNAPSVADTTGCSNGGSTSPDYGCGKVTAEAQPVTSTFPADTVPDLSGLTFDITGPIADNNVEDQGAVATCITGDTTSINSDACPESYWANTADDTGGMGTWVAGADYTISLDRAMGSAQAPANTLIPPHTGTFPDCTAYQNTGTTPTGCPDTTVVMVYGTYHQIGLHLTNAVTHKAIAGATYELCAATASAPVAAPTGCPSGSSVLAKATTDASGKLAFSGLYLGSQNYSVALTHEPRGYKTARTQRLEVPVVTTAAQAGTLYQGTASLAPIKTTVKTHHVTTRENKPVRFNALTGAKHIVGPLKLIKLSKAHHGKARHSGGKITYTPHHGFVGKDVFTYTVRNGVGVTVTGKVIVHVKA
jgi:hypothetical protein